MSAELPLPREEKELLALVAAGDQVAFARVYRVYAGHIYTVAMTYMNQESDADELMQEIFIKVWDKRAMLDSVDNFKSWLFITARNSIYDHFRKQRAESRNRLEYGASQALTVDNSSHPLEDAQYAKILREAVDKLPPQRRKVYEYAKLEGLSPAETGALMGISPHTVKNQLKIANRFIREYLKDNLDLLLIAAIFFNR